RSDIEKPRADWGALDAPPRDEPELSRLADAGLSRALFLDLETGGLPPRPGFLARPRQWDGGTVVRCARFPRPHREQTARLRAPGELTRQFEYLVTFNGRSYDVPFLRGRAVVHGVRLALPPRHLDLLHASRRRWREDLPDCRLQTVERHVCGRRRSGDVPG